MPGVFVYLASPKSASRIPLIDQILAREWVARVQAVRSWGRGMYLDLYRSGVE